MFITFLTLFLAQAEHYFKVCDCAQTTTLEFLTRKNSASFVVQLHCLLVESEIACEWETGDRVSCACRPRKGVLV